MADLPVLSSASLGLKMVVDSENMWQIFLPSDYQVVTSTTGAILVFSTKEELNTRVSSSPILINNGTWLFWLDKDGNKCYTIGARSLSIAYVDNQTYWRWTSDPDSSFAQVPVLLRVNWLEIVGTIATAMLSPTISYAVFLLFKVAQNASGLGDANVWIRYTKENGDEIEDHTVVFIVDIDPTQPGERPQRRDDGWMEVKLGVFLNDGIAGDVNIRFMHRNPDVKSGLTVEGMEIRPV